MNGFSINRLNFKPGYKFNEHEIKGVPIRITVGQRDLEQKTLEIFRRDKMIKKNINFSEVNNEIEFFYSKLTLDLRYPYTRF